MPWLHERHALKRSTNTMIVCLLLVRSSVAAPSHGASFGEAKRVAEEETTLDSRLKMSGMTEG